MNAKETDNIRFIAFVDLLNEMCEQDLLQRNPDNKSHVLIYRAEVDPEMYGVTEGWFSQNIFDAAHELFENIGNSRENLFEVLKQNGLQAIFDENGDFAELSEIRHERDKGMEQE
mgnify:CR=1 FL=1